MKTTPTLTLLRDVEEALRMAANLCGRCTPDVCDDSTAISVYEALPAIQELVRRAEAKPVHFCVFAQDMSGGCFICGAAPQPPKKD